jgi:hypothetical protein
MSFIEIFGKTDPGPIAVALGLLLCFGLILANSRLLSELLWKLFSEEKCPAQCTG